jgi:hypothetical protein
MALLEALNMNWWKWTLLAFVLLLGIAFGVLCKMMGGPRDVYGFLRFALPNMHRGNLKVGDPAPDAELYALDGQTTFRIHDRLSSRPLVLIFGSYT